MNDCRCFEALDRSLRDIQNTPDKQFGGKPIMLGGDFRQTLPVKKKGRNHRLLAHLLLNHICGSTLKFTSLNKT
jgi:hypothetical protein